MWTQKKLKMNSRRLLRDHREAVEILLPLETGTIRGNPGTREQPGNRWFAWALGTGGRRVAPGKPGNWRIWRGAADKAPFISYGGGLVRFCPTASPGPDRHAGKNADHVRQSHEAERSRPGRHPPRQPRRRCQVGMTSIFPPTASAASGGRQPDAGTREPRRCRRAGEARPRRPTPHADLRTRRTPDSRSSQAIA